MIVLFQGYIGVPGGGMYQGQLGYESIGVVGYDRVMFSYTGAPSEITRVSVCMYNKRLCRSQQSKWLTA